MVMITSSTLFAPAKVVSGVLYCCLQGLLLRRHILDRPLVSIARNCLARLLKYRLILRQAGDCYIMDGAWGEGHRRPRPARPAKEAAEQQEALLQPWCSPKNERFEIPEIEEPS